MNFPNNLTAHNYQYIEGTHIMDEPLARLMSHVAIQDDGCWLWTASIGRDGYGHTIQGRKALGTFKYVMAHRLSYELHKGPIPEGLTLDHLCRVRACVNPDHLEPVTNRENLMRSPLTIVHVKDHCHRGHPLAGDNLYWRSNGTRQCRACGRINQRAYTERKKNHD